jgi:hypothetical protein
MKKLSFLTLTVLALSGFMATNARAQNPHFLRCAASGVNADGTLDVSFTIAGLGSNQSIAVTASATADATYGCLNRGQNCPNAANKVNVQSDVSATGTFTSGKNGSIRASLNVDSAAHHFNVPWGPNAGIGFGQLHERYGVSTGGGRLYNLSWNLRGELLPAVSIAKACKSWRTGDSN